MKRKQGSLSNARSEEDGPASPHQAGFEVRVEAKIPANIPQKYPGLLGNSTELIGSDDIARAGEIRGVAEGRAVLVSNEGEKAIATANLQPNRVAFCSLLLLPLLAVPL